MFGSFVFLETWFYWGFGIHYFLKFLFFFPNQTSFLKSLTLVKNQNLNFFFLKSKSFGFDFLSILLEQCFICRLFGYFSLHQNIDRWGPSGSFAWFYTKCLFFCPFCNILYFMVFCYLLVTFALVDDFYPFSPVVHLYVHPLIYLLTGTSSNSHLLFV